ncbi:wax ester/triacylglycerol synthase domain-containing protein [Nocardia amamiensis]|uniref:wax ester/triacylglycerol synthase domain-containing protein n=1 Tax=Nocardia amamiensis TaxID=404578 RepID=UPI0033E21024
MAPQDATMYWLSRRTRNDLFLLYCFADSGQSTEKLRAAVAERSERLADLRVRLRELPADIDYPSWTPCEFAAEQFVEHQLADPYWSRLLDALGDVLASGVDAAVRPWRLHVFRGIFDAPGPGNGPALVAVLQMSHALADGRRASAIARALFSESAPDGDVAFRDGRRAGLVPGGGGVLADSALGLLRMPVRLASTAVRGYQAFRAQQQLAQLTETGKIPPPAAGFPPSPVNRPVGEGISRHGIRMLVFSAEDLRVPGRTVTVVVLAAVSLALVRYLADHAEPVRRLGAQVPMALPESAERGIHPRNNYRSLGVDLFTDEPDLRLRADKIAAALAERRLRAQHPLLSAQDRVTSTTPAPLLRRDVDRYPLDTVPDSIAGHTVVSSVDRGPADLAFGGGLVRFTAGFPALGSVMHLTHGVHGLGDTVTVSVHADSAVVPDVDAYADLLRSGMKEVIAAL